MAQTGTGKKEKLVGSNRRIRKSESRRFIVCMHKPKAVPLHATKALGEEEV
jgi:hypothetical protein